jgi:hypothetical protein
MKHKKKKYKEGDVIMVKFGRKTYPTHITKGVQRFYDNPIYLELHRAGCLNFNDLAIKVAEGKIKASTFLDIRMGVGYSVSGLYDCYPGYTVVNPVWDEED